MASSAPSEPDARLRDLAAAHWRVVVALTGGMIGIYFGFILLIAFNKPLLAHLVLPGLSLGILLGALVIVCSWALTWVYVRWANTYYDSALNRLRE